MNGIQPSLGNIDIKGPHYLGPSYTGQSTLDLITGPYGHFAGSNELNTKFFTFQKDQSKQTFREIMAYTDFAPDGDVHMSVLRGPWRAPKADKLMGSNIHNEEYIYNPPVNGIRNPDDRMWGWLDSSQNEIIDKKISYVDIPKFEELIVSRYEHQPEPELDKWVTKIVSYKGPLNDLGKHLSEIDNLRQPLNDYDNTKEKVRDMSDISNLGVSSIEGVIYAINRRPNGEVVIYTGTRAEEYLAREADILGVPLEYKRNAALGEEAMHHNRGDYDNKISSIDDLIPVEKAAKHALLDHYIKLAEDSSNPQLRDIYLKLVKSIENDIRTVDERYSAVWDKAHNNHKSSDLEMALVAEAIANGYETDEEINDYVASKLNEQNEDNVKNSSLEEIADEADSEESNDDDLTNYETVSENEEDSTDADYSVSEDTNDKDSETNDDYVAVDEGSAEE